MPVRRREGLSLITAALFCAALLWPVVAFAEFPHAVVNGVSDQPWQGTYRYDGAGNIKSIGANYYLYDGARRLVEATAITNVQDDVRHYSYDAFGNLHLVEVMDGAAPPTSFGASLLTNRLDEEDCSPGSICVFASYDPVIGHQITGPDNALYDYDAVDMMTTLTTGSRHELYIYDANDQRIATVTNANTTPSWRYTLRDLGANVIREWTSSGGTWSWIEDYVHRDGILLASISDSAAGEQRVHFHVDHLNSPRLITDDEGRKISVHTYWPFGIEAEGSDIDSERRKYTGHERDFAGTGDINDLDYMHARYYAPGESRFLAVDCETADLGRPQSWNRFVYGSNNPVNRFDPDGRADVAAKMSQAYAATAVKLNKLADEIEDAGPEATSAYTRFFARQFTGKLRDAADVLTLGTSTGSALGKGGDSYDIGIAVSKDVGLASAGILLLVEVAPVDDDKISAPPARRGNAPIGDDGHPIEIHHDNQDPNGPYREMTRTDHRGGDNFKKNHPNTGQDPSKIDRKTWRDAVRDYWKRMWDSGRFLPK